MDVFEELVRLRKLGQKCALATIVEVGGSIPSFQSAKLLVREDGSMVGTVGGGCVEAQVFTAAREAMETGRPKLLNFNLGQDAAYESGLICGGQVDIFVEPILPQPRALIFGAGHISKSLSKVASLAASPLASSTTARATPTGSGSPRPTRFWRASTRRFSRAWR
jgi:xanthine dehydrogenase accessory factor